MVDVISWPAGESYITALETRNQTRDLEVIAQIALQTAQLIAYYDLADDAIESRDLIIDKTIDFITYLEDKKVSQDLPMLNLKKSVLTGLGLPSVDMCSSAIQFRQESINDGHAVDEKSVNYARETCGGIPSGWGLHEGTLMAAKSTSYIGGMVGSSSKRQQETFRRAKTDLVRNAQAGMKSLFNASEVLSQYSQAQGIYAGLADLFIQGFNSAGAGLGVALGKLGDNAPTQTAADPVSDPIVTPKSGPQ